MQKKNLKEIKAVIFDMDGLMLDTEKINATNVENVMKEIGYNIPNFESWYYENASGHRGDKVYLKLKKSFGLTMDEESFSEKVYGRRDEYIKLNGVPQKKGLIKLLNYLKANNYKIGLASSSRTSKIKRLCEGANVSLNYFDHIVGGEEVLESKPNPMIYKLACKKLGVNPNEAMAIEDSDVGIEAAYKAGLTPILIPDVIKNSEKTKAMAFKVVKSLNEVINIL